MTQHPARSVEEFVIPTVGVQSHCVAVELGALPIRLSCNCSDFVRLIKERYLGFWGSSSSAIGEFEIELQPPGVKLGPENVRVLGYSGQWLIEREDFRVQWNPSTARGSIQLTYSIHSLDSALRVVYTLLLARNSGFLLHASGAIRNGHAFLLSGASGTGKTTIARLAPPDAALLSDDICIVVRHGDFYKAVGGPFYCELGRPGENREAPIKCLYLLSEGLKNEIQPIKGTAAIRGLLKNILFFASDPELVKLVFETACEFANRVPVRRLTFVQDSSIWELIA